MNNGFLLKCELGVDDLIDSKYRAQAFMPISLTSVASRERPRGLEVDISTVLLGFVKLLNRSTFYLAFSALSSAISPPLSLFLASSSNLFDTNADSSLTLTSAKLEQCKRSLASMALPPNFAIWHISP
jgi:hypothetical protein